MHTHHPIIAGLALIGTMSATPTALIAAPIAATATGTANFSGAASLLTDGVVPPQNTLPGDSRLVVWNPTSTVFTFDFGTVQTVGSLLLSADNNDDYQIAASVDGQTYSTLFTVLASDGTVTPAQGGTDTFSTDPASPFYIGRSFAPVSARFLQLSASNGDFVYTVGELDAFAPAGAPVPEPASVWLVTLGLAGIAFSRRHWSR